MFNEKEYQKQYREKNKEKSKEYKKQYYLEHKDERKIKDKQYYLDNKEKIKLNVKKYQQNNKYKKYAKEYRIETKDIRKQYKKEYRMNHKYKIIEHDKKYRELCMVNLYKRNDKKRGFNCDLTSEWMKENITSKPCVYCGDTKQIGCDRIDNSKGHTMNNVVPSCKICNYARHNHFTIDEMYVLGATIRQIKINRKIIKISELSNVIV